MTYRTVEGGRLRWVTEIPEYETAVAERTRRDSIRSARMLRDYYAGVGENLRVLLVAANRAGKAVATMAEHIGRVWGALEELALPRLRTAVAQALRDEAGDEGRED